nr:glutathione S-transferase family protein [Oceanococcus sp. HetDA_MAG_MS8]
MSADLRLYALPHSLYSAKTRANLRCKGLAFAETPATLLRIKRVLQPRTGLAMIPVLELGNGVLIQDTSVIFDALEGLYPEPALLPSHPEMRLAAYLLELFADEWLLLPAMHYRWDYLADPEHRADIEAHFGLLLSAQAPQWLRRQVGSMLGKTFHQFLPGLGINERTRPVIQQRYGNLLDTLQAHLRQYPYLLGSRPSLADVAMMGPLHAHLGRDLVPRRLMQERSPAVFDWVQRVHEGAAVSPGGDWLEAVPSSLDAVFKQLFEDFWPFLQNSATRVQEWIKEHPGRVLPRGVGNIAFELGPIQSQRAVTPYSVWMAQRSLNQAQVMQQSGALDQSAWLQRTGGLAALRDADWPRLQRISNRILPGVR